MSKKLIVIAVILNLIVVLSGNVLAAGTIKDYKLKTEEQLMLFRQYKKEPFKASLAAVIPGGGHIYNGRVDKGLFFILSNSALYFLYNETNESAYITAGTVLKIIEMSAAYDGALKYNKKLKKRIIDYTEHLRISDNQIKLNFAF